MASGSLQQGAADAAEAEKLAISCEGVSNSLVTQDNNGDTVLHLAIGADAPDAPNASDFIQAILQTR